MIIGLDVGGTHTDVVLIGQSGLIKEIKVPTDPSDLFATVLEGLEKVTHGIDPKEIRRAVLSTTLTTNCVVQKNTIPVGMLVSAGPGIDPEFFRTGDHYHAVSGSIDHRGREVEPIRAEEIRSAGAKLKDAGIRYVGVVSKFSVRNPAHEQQMHDLLDGQFDKVFLGHRFSGNLNFPRRIATTYLNAAVYPIHKDFFEAVQRSLDKKGLSIPIRILKPDGGNMRFSASIEYPAQTILSGPAASIMGSIAFAPKNHESLVLDIGGTTTDMAILLDGVPLLAPLGIEIGEYRTVIRSLLTRSIGLGGDSAVRASLGEISIGPDRLGNAMAYGGPVPTPTDALFVLGLGQDGDRKLAIEGITAIAGALKISVEEAAERIFNQTCRKILDAAQQMVASINSKPVYTVHELCEGVRIRPRTILVLGGPAPLFADRLAALSGLKVEVIPHFKVANAIGAALARTTCEVILFADTEQLIATAPGENFSRRIPNDFSKKDAIDTALSLLKDKALRRGANPNYLEMEIIEEQEFNMVRGFYTAGKNIRIRAQVKPGLIHGYDPVTGTLSREL